MPACHAASLGPVDLIGFLLLGLVGSFGHCGAMCSPFVLFVSRRYCAEGCPRRATLTAQLSYHAGRITTYAVLGAAAGALGNAIELTGHLVGVHRLAAVLAGATIVLFAVSTVIPITRGLDAGGLFARVMRLMGGRVPGHPFVTGLLLGLLPCGLLYSAVAAAAALGGAAHGAAALAIFGAGTAPTLLGVSIVDATFARHRALVNRVSHAFMFAAGVWFVWTGLSR